jgi:hypothetical protein
MDVKQALKDLFNSPWVKSFPAPALVASVLAAMIHPVLAGVGFQASGAALALAKIGFQLADELIPPLLEVAKKGLSELSTWLVQQIRSKPEINEAAARTLVEQAPPLAQTVSETHPDDKDEIAATLGKGLTESGGAAAQIADQYQAAMKEAGDLKKLVEEMNARIDVWASQTVEARRGSLIENVEQYIEGSGGKQEIRAEDDSIISGVKQVIKSKPAENSKDQ